MASESMEFANGARALDAAKKLRGRVGQLRAGFGGLGVSYGLGAYGSPIGAVTGVQSPTEPGSTTGGGATTGDAMSTDQFGGGGDAVAGGDGGGGM